MTDAHDRSHLDAVIDDVVRDMMQRDARGDFAARVLRSIEEPPRRAWYLGAPAFAAAAVAVVLLAATMLFVDTHEPAAVPSIQVVAGPAAALETAAPAPRAAEPPPAATAPPAAAATAESIFGPRRGQVGAASLRAVPQVHLALVLSESLGTAQPRTQTLTMVLSSGENRDGRAGAAGQPQLSVSATPEVLASGAIRVRVDVRAPVQQQVTVTLVPGASTQLLESVDQASGRRITIGATATLLKPERPQR